MKDRTNKEGIDPVTDKSTDNARRRGELESRDGGKHGDPQERTMIEEILDPATVHMATRSRKGYWRMSQNEIVRYALNNCWLEEQGAPDMNAMAAVAAQKKLRSHPAWTERSGVKAVWIALHYGAKAPS